MKKNILAIAIATAVAAPTAMADAKVYGQFNLAIDSVTENGMDVVHRNSRLGVKGSEDLGNGLKAIYQMEGTISYGDFKADRNTFAGIGGGFGTVVMGRHDTPLRMIQPKDGFADSAYAGNNTGVFNGFKHALTAQSKKVEAGSVVDDKEVSAPNLSGEDRINNVLAYLSPSFNGVSFAVALATLQDGDNSALDNAISANVAYGSKKSGLFAAVGMTQVAESKDDNDDGKKNERTNTRLTVQYNEGGMLGYAMYNSVSVGDNILTWKEDDGSGTAVETINASEFLEGSSITLGGAYKMGAITPRAKVAMITYSKKAGELKDSSMSMAVGVDYALGKNTRVYAEYAGLDKNNRATMIANDDGKLQDVTAISVGMFHKF